MKSKITGGQTTLVFETKVLNKYNVKYYKCKETGFIQTEEPYWLGEAYSSAITKLDIGIVFRNEQLKNRVSKLISTLFNPDKLFLDYAGGYGLFTRMMRDKGYDFYHTDRYCKNLFAEHFDLSDLKDNPTFEIVTAFEVFEHLSNPLEEIKEMIRFGDNLIFSTELQPADGNVKDWWYLAPETGQHIAFYTKSSLEFIARALGYHFTTDGHSLHLFTRQELIKNPFEERQDPYLVKIMRRKVNRYDRKIATPNRKSLLEADFNYIKAKLSNE
jgi:2-polyprenyl-3-methyl-5-hydroxy-6-metoxy-1,4-benzoquinol methylase